MVLALTAGTNAATAAENPPRPAVLFCIPHHDPLVQGSLDMPYRFVRTVEKFVDHGGGVFPHPWEQNVIRQALVDLTEHRGAKLPLEQIIETDPNKKPRVSRIWDARLSSPTRSCLRPFPKESEAQSLTVSSGVSPCLTRTVSSTLGRRSRSSTRPGWVNRSLFGPLESRQADSLPSEQSRNQDLTPESDRSCCPGCFAHVSRKS